jgi:hypothetical protein
MSRKLPLFVALIALTAGLAAAGPPEYFTIARISYLQGHVSFQHAGDLDWVAASINMPLQPSDRIYTSEDGRAEIEFTDGSVFRMAEGSDAEIIAMNEDLVRLRFLVGLSTLNAQSGLDFEITTPAADFHTLRRGVYRFFVGDNGESDGIVRKGLMEVHGPDSVSRLESGEMAYVTSDANPAVRLAPYDRRDGWDEWNERRNADQVAYRSGEYLPNQVNMGASDLDHYGRWVELADYGPAWVPSVGSGWYPYWEGRWSYRPVWGWTWVSYEPWGWLPYHYGRWFFSASYGWSWLPGPGYGFNFWSPALVRFYTGAGWLYWCPLGPGDYYNVNLFHFNRIYEPHLNKLRLLQTRAPADLMNLHFAGALHGVRYEDFVNNSIGGRTGISPVDGSRIIGQREMVAGVLRVEPPSRSAAPAPNLPFVRPLGNVTAGRGLPDSSTQGSARVGAGSRPGQEEPKWGMPGGTGRNEPPAMSPPIREYRNRQAGERSEQAGAPDRLPQAPPVGSREGGSRDVRPLRPERSESNPSVPSQRPRPQSRITRQQGSAPDSAGSQSGSSRTPTDSERAERNRNR